MIELQVGGYVFPGVVHIYYTLIRVEVTDGEKESNNKKQKQKQKHPPTKQSKQTN